MDSLISSQYLFHALHPLGEPGVNAEPGGLTQQNQALIGHFAPAENHVFPPPILLHHHGSHQPQNVSAVNNFDAQSMAPPPKQRRKKAPTLRAKDWEPYKARVLELHDTQKKPLNEVREIIEKEFGFTAEIRQYRTRITQWGKDKNIKPAEMAAIVRKRQQRKILESEKREQIFTVRDREVEPQKIDRWMSRHEISQTHLYAPSPAASDTNSKATPSAVDCRTVSERGSIAESPAFSEMSLNFSSGGSTPRALSPVASPSTQSIAGTIPSWGNTFTGQSPAPIYQSLPAQPPASSSVQAPSSSISVLRQYRYQQAQEEYLRQELSMAETMSVNEHLPTLDLATSLAQVLIAQGRYKSAEEMIHRVVEGYKKESQSESAKALDAFDLLGRLFLHRGLYSEAEKHLRRTFKSKKDVLGEEHPSTLVSMSRLSTAYIFQNRYLEAEELELQALEISTRVLGEVHPETMLRESNLGLIYTRLGRLHEAECLIQQALYLSKTLFGDEHTRTLLNMNRLLSVFTHQGLWDKAEILAIQVADLGTKLLGEEHPSTVQGKANLALVFESQGRLWEAEELCVQVLMTRKTLGQNHPDTISSIDDFIKMYERQGNYKEAAVLTNRRFFLAREGY
ncbi:uncharacterized protein BKA55DRAFT_537697 [Fusarium redolens]|uniref:Clr5 domain-containing protein n=1 Tax=Fusarium redolens TaxID=48865 RepID=A0A9P9KJV0_FUSRE|nr:uncharacterized protein BKA55DRAFT_537697 [Fusarium redolens]KAH7255284.1 hypothetical protein BKA55DRAFT_537697 [Fusarium redolens]